MAEFPHCDSRILHAPDECRYCDMFPGKQVQRLTDRVNFTGHHDFGKLTCPAEEARTLESMERWPGNIREKRTDAEMKVDSDKFWIEVTRLIKERDALTQ